MSPVETPQRVKPAVRRRDFKREREFCHLIEQEPRRAVSDATGTYRPDIWREGVAHLANMRVQVIPYALALVAAARRAARDLHIQHLRKQISSPWTNGNIEVFWAVLQPEVLDRQRFASLADAESAFARFVQYYNYHRLSGVLGGDASRALRRHRLQGRWLSAHSGASSLAT